MRLLMITLVILPASFAAAAASDGDELSYTERMGLYADWSTFILLILAVVALVRFWKR